MLKAGANVSRITVSRPCESINTLVNLVVVIYCYETDLLSALILDVAALFGFGLLLSCFSITHNALCL